MRRQDATAWMDAHISECEFCDEKATYLISARTVFIVPLATRTALVCAKHRREFLSNRLNL